jgi:hypothetical protein
MYTVRAAHDKVPQCKRKIHKTQLMTHLKLARPKSFVAGTRALSHLHHLLIKQVFSAL